MTDQLPEVELTPEQEARAAAMRHEPNWLGINAARLIVHLQDRVKALESCLYRSAESLRNVSDGLGRIIDGASTPPAESEKTLRRLLAFAYSGGHLYGDDGELQDSRLPHPIDYVRDSVAEIERKINTRGMDRLLEESSLLRRCYNELPNPEHESDFDRRQRLRQLLQDLAKTIEWLPRAAVTTEGGR